MTSQPEAIHATVGSKTIHYNVQFALSGYHGPHKELIESISDQLHAKALSALDVARIQQRMAAAGNQAITEMTQDVIIDTLSPLSSTDGTVQFEVVLTYHRSDAEDAQTMRGEAVKLDGRLNRHNRFSTVAAASQWGQAQLGRDANAVLMGRAYENSLFGYVVQGFEVLVLDGEGSTVLTLAGDYAQEHFAPTSKNPALIIPEKTPKRVMATAPSELAVKSNLTPRKTILATPPAPEPASRSVSDWRQSVLDQHGSTDNDWRQIPKEHYVATTEDELNAAITDVTEGLRRSGKISAAELLDDNREDFLEAVMDAPFLTHENDLYISRQHDSAEEIVKVFVNKLFSPEWKLIYSYWKSNPGEHPVNTVELNQFTTAMAARDHLALMFRDQRDLLHSYELVRLDGRSKRKTREERKTRPQPDVWFSLFSEKFPGS